MALASPGVQVTIIDQSQYLPASTNSVPLVILATAQNKAAASGTTVAPGTIKANANKLYKVTSQRDLVALYGNPFFYKTTNGTPIQGYELNEYGLLAAYSLLAQTNGCYVLRADIDLGSLVGSLSRPRGAPAEGTYWLDTTTSTWGIYEWSSITNKFTNKIPLVIVNTDDLIGGTPLPSLGNIGDYAMVAIYPETVDPIDQNMLFYKNKENIWVDLGSLSWMRSIPAVTASISDPTLLAGQTFTVSQLGSLADYSFDITVPAAPDNTVEGIAQLINDLGISDVRADVNNGRLEIYFSPIQDPFYAQYLQFSSPDSVLTDMGISSTLKYYSPQCINGSSAQMPLWASNQSQPHPTGSVWIKTSAVGAGINTVISRFSGATNTFVQKPVTIYRNVGQATATLDSTGGRNIPAGTIVGAFNTMSEANNISENIYYYERLATGVTVATGSVANPVIQNNAFFYVQVSIPKIGFAYYTNPTYTVTMPGAGSVGATEFVTAWQAANIPNTTATVTTDGKIQLTNTIGGEIMLFTPQGNNPYKGVLDDVGLSSITNPNILGVNALRQLFEGLPQFTTTGSGTGAVFSCIVYTNEMEVIDATSGGTGYQVGDLVTVSGTSFGGTTPLNDLVIRVMSTNSGAIDTIALVSGNIEYSYINQVANWRRITYVANEGAPFADPPNNTNWFYSAVDQVDIMVNQAGAWKGYRNVNYDANGQPIPTGTNNTDPLGPIIAASEPTTQSDGTPLVYGDLWIDSSDLENYPVIYRWQSVEEVDQWALIDNTDDVTMNGIVFEDARWAPNDSTDPVNDPYPTIRSLLTSNYLDADAPNPSLYPQGILLFNTRRSGYNVKEFRRNYFSGVSFPDITLPFVKNAWVTVSGLKTDGSPYMGRKAQRSMVVKALGSAVATNMTIREEDNFFNLIACPNYPELQPEMVSLNNERNNTGYIIGDTPLRLPDQATDIENWAKNTAGATSTGEDGCVTRDEYLGLFYPAGITTDTTKTQVVVPASHMMLSTFLRNDTIAYPWLAPAGTRRGTISNATNIGYIDAATGEFQVVKNRIGIRDVLYTQNINPLANFTNVGLLNYGNKNSKSTDSALDRINVARLVCYIRERLQVLARPFVFEPNDALTRSQITSVVQTLFVDLVAKRGLYDYLVVCDTTNNTPARIDRNQLYVDIAIEPVKAAEFIYIPVRILNTGEIAQRGNAIFTNS